MGSGASKQKAEPPPPTAGKDKMFGDMTPEEQAAVQTLGWSGRSWDAGEDSSPFLQSWDRMGEEKHEAARALGMLQAQFVGKADEPEPEPEPVDAAALQEELSKVKDIDGLVARAKEAGVSAEKLGELVGSDGARDELVKLIVSARTAATNPEPESEPEPEPPPLDPAEVAKNELAMELGITRPQLDPLFARYEDLAGDNGELMKGDLLKAVPQLEKSPFFKAIANLLVDDGTSPGGKAGLIHKKTFIRWVAHRAASCYASGTPCHALIVTCGLLLRLSLSLSLSLSFSLCPSISAPL
eukprot:COSAG05_NODE_707_length_7848_cov_6.252420_3_plen_298_part_00